VSDKTTAKTPRESQIEFHETYAWTMMMWAGLEDALGYAFFPLFGDKSFSAQSIFYAQQGMKAKKTLVDAAYVAFAWDTEIYKKWLEVSKKLDKSIADRNRLTHGQQLTKVDKTGEMHESIQNQLFSVANRFKGRTFLYFTKDIEGMRTRAGEVRKDLVALGVAINHLVSGDKATGSIEFSYDEAVARLSLSDVRKLKLGKFGSLAAVYPND
jgi:hypothetical protein